MSVYGSVCPLFPVTGQFSADLHESWYAASLIPRMIMGIRLDAFNTLLDGVAGVDGQRDYDEDDVDVV